MKIVFFVSSLVLFINGSLIAQSIKTDPKNFTVSNRKVTFDGDVIYLDAADNNGVLWLNNSSFKNGTIEVDIKGKDVQGRSFVGIAFNGQDNNTFDAVYFRPFNFKNPERDTHSVQYISLPGNDWELLRNKFPGKYESKITPVPVKVDDWLHAKIVVNYPKVKVYVGGSAQPSLEIDQVTNTKAGKVGFWVGNGSDGWFRNLKVVAGK